MIKVSGVKKRGIERGGRSGGGLESREKIRWTGRKVEEVVSR